MTMSVLQPINIESFDEMDANTAQAIVANQGDDSEKVTWKLFNDDYWQNGDLWNGPRIETGTASSTVMSEIERGLVSNNVLREVTLRHCNAVIFRQPMWSSVPRRALGQDEKGNDKKPTDDEVSRGSDLDGFLTSWWDSPLRGTYTDIKGRMRTCNVHKLLRRAAELFAVSGRACLRLFVPPDERNKEGILPGVPFADSLKRIYVELCEPDAAAVYVHRPKMAQIGVYLWRQSGKDGDQQFVELTYLDDEGQTVLRQIVPSKAGTEPVGRTFDLSGSLMLFEMNDEPFILPSMVSQQNSITKTLTMGDRNENLAGFPERVLKDVQLDGKYEDDPNAPNGRRFVPNRIDLGAGTVNVFQGVEYTDEEGRKRRTVPGYERMEPLGSEVFDTAFDKKRERMLHQSGQTHVLISGDATASGVSREHARDEFKLSIAPTQNALDAAGTWLLNTVVALAFATSSDKSNAYADLKVDFSCQIHEGPLSSAERTEDRNQVNDGLMSRQRAIERGGVADSDAENNRIAAERDASLEMMQDRAAVVETLTRAGAGIGAAARVAGFSTDDADRLERSDFVDPNVDPNANPNIDPKAEPADNGGNPSGDNNGN